MRRLSPLLLALFLLVPLAPDAAARHRAVRVPTTPVFAPDSVPGWLTLHGVTIGSTEYYPGSAGDLAPLRNVIGDATIVGLGDATHGTREFYTVKVRLIDFLVRELSFDTLILEAPVPQVARLNDYIHGGSSDPRLALAETSDALMYGFWETEEILSLLEWMRAWNAAHPERPVQIAGADIFGQAFAWKNVVAWLDTVDAGLAATARAEYACIGDNHVTTICGEQATRVYDAIRAAEATLVARSSRAAYEQAVLHARVPVQFGTGLSLRDEFMAENVEWIRDRISTTRKVVYWAHNGHVSRLPMEFTPGIPAGQFLAQRHGTGYFAIGTMTGSGTFLQWNNIRGVLTDQTVTWPALGSESHEANLRQRGFLPFLVPLRGVLPSWLSEARPMNASRNGGALATRAEVLPSLFDAVIYIDRTTPLRRLP